MLLFARFSLDCIFDVAAVQGSGNLKAQLQFELPCFFRHPLLFKSHTE